MSNKKNDLKNQIKRKTTAVSQIFDDMELEDKETPEEKTIENKADTDKPVQTSHIPNNTKEEEEFFSSIKTTKKKKAEPVITTFYLEEDLHPILQNLYEKNGKGFKSKFISSAIRYVLVQYGLIEDDIEG